MLDVFGPAGKNAAAEFKALIAQTNAVPCATTTCTGVGMKAMSALRGVNRRMSSAASAEKASSCSRCAGVRSSRRGMLCHAGDRRYGNLNSNGVSIGE